MKIIIEIDDRSKNGDTTIIDFIQALTGWLVGREDISGLVKESLDENSVVFNFTIKK